MENKDRNQQILEMACELLEMMNQQVDNAFVEDVAVGGEGEESGASQALVSITVPNPANLIGFRGKNLAALQLVLSLAVKNKLGEWVRVLVDVNDYRQEQKSRLEKMVQALATKVLATGKPAAMTSMSSYERRICHMALQEMEGVVSESEGEGEERHIVIKPKV